MQLLFDNGDEHVSGQGAPDFHRVLAGAQKFLDSQVLVDSVEQLGDILPVGSQIQGININIKIWVNNAALVVFNGFEDDSPLAVRHQAGRGSGGGG